MTTYWPRVSSGFVRRGAQCIMGSLNLQQPEPALPLRESVVAWSTKWRVKRSEDCGTSASYSPIIQSEHQTAYLLWNLRSHETWHFLWHTAEYSGQDLGHFLSIQPSIQSQVSSAHRTECCCDVSKWHDVHWRHTNTQSVFNSSARRSAPDDAADVNIKMCFLTHCDRVSAETEASWKLCRWTNGCHSVRLNVT